jgi:hypothetical protein
MQRGMIIKKVRRNDLLTKIKKDRVKLRYNNKTKINTGKLRI